MKILLPLLIVMASCIESAGGLPHPAGELNRDCKVDWLDLSILSSQWLNTDWSGSQYLNLDGTNGINSSDFAMLAQNWLREGKVYPYRWVYVGNLLGNQSDVDQVSQIVQTASEHGVNGMVLMAALDTFDFFSPGDFERLEQVKQVCQKHDIEIIPIIFNVARAWSILSHDKNLAAGIPVKDALFVVEGEQAHLIPDPAVEITNGSFEHYNADQLDAYSHSYPGEVSFVDTEVFKSGNASIRFENLDLHNLHAASIGQQVKLHEYRCYRISCWVRTGEPQPDATIRILVKSSTGRQLVSARQTDIYADQWQQVSAGFNSFDSNNVTVQISCRTPSKLWIDDLKIEEVGLLNVLRRPGTPVTVKSDETGVVYEEGRDYAPISDPVLDFWFDRDPPPIKILKGRFAGIRNAEHLRVSYYHGMRLIDEMVTACMSEPALYDMWRQQAKLIHQYLAPDKYFLAMDEIWAGGSCEACKKREMTMAQILGDCITKQVQIIREVNPDAHVFIWSDMLDPNHNARADYFLIDGDFTGSWEYVPKDLIIVCWWYRIRNESLAFFSSLGFRTLAGAYYDGDTLENPIGWLEALDYTPGASGIMYTTWQNKYDLLAEFGDLVSCVWH